MTDRVKRLGKLLDVHATLESLGEARRAAHLAQARLAREEAQALAARFDDAQSLSALFPALYHARIQNALAAAQAAEAEAAREAEALGLLRLRAKGIGRLRDEAQAAAERARAEALMLDWVEARQALASSRGQTGT